MIYIAIVSHGHEDLLIASQLGGLLSAHCSSQASQEKNALQIWIKDNKPSQQLKLYCQKNDVNYIDEQAGLGFGHNNNFLFQEIQNKIGFTNNDLFVVMNPDVTIAPTTIVDLADKMQAAQQKIATINLYRDPVLQEYDTNIRYFPRVSSLLSLIATGSATKVFDKSRISELENNSSACVEVEWSSGAFLAFTPAHYRNLGGFDETYFMYFEDVDICYRSYKLLGQHLHYYPQLKAIHTAARKNRNIFSLHSKWFFHSFFTFLFHRYIASGAKMTSLK